MTETDAEPTRSSLPLQGERVTFAGSLSSMTRQQAAELVERHGGQYAASLTQQVTLLVIGEQSLLLEADGNPSSKLEQALERNRNQADIRILSETDWLYLLGIGQHQQEVRRLYTAAMLSRLLDVSPRIIRRWERAGLIRPVRQVYRLAYYDFQEVTHARRLAELLSSGVSPGALEKSLTRLAGILAGSERSLAQLEILAHGRHLLLRDEHGLVNPDSRQRHFDFDHSEADDDERPAILQGFTPKASPTPARIDWLDQGCRLLDESRLEEAEQAFRLFLKDHDRDPEANFYLAETLFRQERPDAALERYLLAVEADHHYLEAWTQLGCLYESLGQLEEALHAFYTALSLHDDYPDAHWQIANVYEQLHQPEEARPHWEKYLEYDDRGPWAEEARQRLGSG